MAYIVMVYIVMAYIAMAHKVMAYIVMAYMVRCVRAKTVIIDDEYGSGLIVSFTGLLFQNISEHADGDRRKGPVPI